MRNPYKVTIVSKDPKERIYGVVYQDPKLSGIGFPGSWGSRTHATRYMAECLLCIPWKEWRTVK